MLDAIFAADTAAVTFVQNNLKCAFLDVVMPLITIFGENGIFWIAVALVLLCLNPKTRKIGAVMGLAMLMGLIFGNGLLKNLVARPRPYWLDENAAILVNDLKDYSFPSGHSLVSFEAAVTLLLCKCKKTGIASLVIAFLVAFSRVYLYVHYPTDVIAGALLGTLFAFVSFVIFDKYICRGSDEIRLKKT